jgi:hypothetical protein
MDAFDFTNDPIAAAQVETLASLLGEQWSQKARDGFLMTSGRFVDDFGADRTAELAWLYKTHLLAGRVALRRSLEALFDSVGSLAQFELDFPVFINDPVRGSLGVFPQLPILGIEEIALKLYRVMDTKATVHGTGERLKHFIMREGKLPYLEPPVRLVLRKKLRIYWCSYECYESPLATRCALQILSTWNADCKLRATLPTAGMEETAFVAFNGDSRYSDNTPGEFAGYFVELRAQDHPELPGGGLQVGVVGSPAVSALEEWIDAEHQWSTIWSRSPSG